MKHRIAIISDTHSLLRPEAAEVLRTCEVILHGGDVADPALLEELRTFAPIYAVRGNVDKDMDGDLPEELDVILYGFHFYMIHKKKQIRTKLDGAEIVIYGHSHKYETCEQDGVLYLNPGSCGPRRFLLPVTMAVMTVDEEEHTYQIERIDLLTESKEDVLELSERDMDQLIRAIIKDMKANRPAAVIAKRNQVEESFVNQILQIYTTHPGIDVDGILNRMDIWGK